jgi:3-oxoacid CoA-transferase subunit A
MNKVVASAAEPVACIKSRSSIATAGLGLSGIPSALTEALYRSGVKDLEIISNNVRFDDNGLRRLLAAGRVRRMVAPYVGGDQESALQLEGEIEVELIQQDLLAERLRAGGSGLAAFFTRTGVGTRMTEIGLPRKYDSTGAVALAAPPKEMRTFCGTEYVLERGITADFGLVRAWKGDRHGNLSYGEADRTFNTLCALAGRVTIAEVEELVEPGELNPDEIHTPGALVQHVVAP